MINDFEREHLTDQMYLGEYQQEIEDEWRRWEEEQSKLPAKIIITNPIKKEKINENTTRNLRNRN